MSEPKPQLRDVVHRVHWEAATKLLREHQPDEAAGMILALPFERPVIAWPEKFKFEPVAGVQVPHSPVLDVLRSSRMLPLLDRLFISPAGNT